MIQLKSGFLIAIEGIDGSGKSTLAKNISSLLEQREFNTTLTREPGSSQLGKEIRQLVCTQNIPITGRAQYLLFAADRAQHFDELVIPALEEKKIVISDRMSDSSLAYQGYGNGLDLAMIRSINEWSMRSVRADLTVFVRIPVEIALERCSKRGALSVYEKKDFLMRVADGFEEIYKNRNDVIIVNGIELPNILSQQTLNAIIEWIQSKKLLS